MSRGINKCSSQRVALAVRVTCYVIGRPELSFSRLAPKLHFGDAQKFTPHVDTGGVRSDTGTLTLIPSIRRTFHANAEWPIEDIGLSVSREVLETHS